MSARAYIFILLISIISAAPTNAKASDVVATSAAQSLGFVDHYVTANGIRFHYVTAGKGDPVLLIPGWPESWYAWRFVMKQMAAAGREVYAMDPRGMGDSAAPSTGYDLATSAQDVHAFIQAVGLGRPGGVDIVAHDVGNWFAYADANAYPKDVRRLVLSEAPLPGILRLPPAPSDVQNLHVWQFSFNRLPDIPEVLVQGHERAYLDFLFKTKATKTAVFDSTAVDEYTRVFLLPGIAHASFEYYRQALNESGLKQLQAWEAQKIAMPVFTIGGSDGLGDGMLKSWQPYAANISGVVLGGCGHFLAEECPDDYTRAVFGFWRQVPGGAT
jgi:pimeloyl-ACP methyl ester carboxylesterase